MLFLPQPDTQKSRPPTIGCRRGRDALYQAVLQLDLAEHGKVVTVMDALHGGGSLGTGLGIAGSVRKLTGGHVGTTAAAAVAATAAGTSATTAALATAAVVAAEAASATIAAIAAPAIVTAMTAAAAAALTVGQVAGVGSVE